MNISFSPPDIREEDIEEVVDTLRSGWITTGPKTKQFEQEIAKVCHTKKSAALSSATAAMEMTLRLFGIGPGDEVITTVYTYTASCSVICHVGATPVLVDTLPDSFDMDPMAVEEAITAHTKAIICVDLGGRIYPYYDRIRETIARKQALTKAAIENSGNAMQKALGRILLMADGAHSFGATRVMGVYSANQTDSGTGDGMQHSGSVADFTGFSFHAVKNLTTAEGGAVTWRTLPELSDAEITDEEIYQQFMLFSLHGQSKDALAKTKVGAWEYDIVAPYYKCNMTDIQASLGLSQIRRYPKVVQRRQEIIRSYNDAFCTLPVEILPHMETDAKEQIIAVSSGHLYLVRLTGRNREETNEVIVKMAEAGIATNVHYKPLPMMTAYKTMGFDIIDYPHAYAQYKNEITLPLHTCLSDEEVEYVIQHFCAIVGASYHSFKGE